MPHFVDQLTEIIESQNLNEIIMNGVKGMLCIDPHKTTVQEFFSDQDPGDWLIQIQDFAWEMGEKLDPFKPFAGGIFKNRYRWHSIMPPLTDGGPVFSLRRHRFEELALSSFSMPSDTLKLLEQILAQGHSLMICGATGSGKTTLLHSLLKEFFSSSRVVILEDVKELPVGYPLWIHLKSRPEQISGAPEITLSQLLYESLRLHPQRMVIGEIRQKELLPFIEASATAHSGVLTTFHAGSMDDVRRRLSILTHNGGHRLFINEEKSLWCLFLEGKEYRIRALERFLSS